MEEHVYELTMERRHKIEGRDQLVDRLYEKAKQRLRDQGQEPDYDIRLSDMPQDKTSQDRITLELREKLSEYQDRILNGEDTLGTRIRRDMLRTLMEQGGIDTKLFRQSVQDATGEDTSAVDWIKAERFMRKYIQTGTH